MQLPQLLDDIVQASRRADLGNYKGLDGEEANDDGNADRVHVISQECRLDATNKGVQDNAHGQQERCCDDVHPSPAARQLPFWLNIVPREPTARQLQSWRQAACWLWQ